MSKSQTHNLILNRLAVLLILQLLGFGGVVSPVNAQPVLGARNISLGGGGTAYISGAEAAFWNPANLMLNDRYGTFHISTGHIGMLYQPVLSGGPIEDQLAEFREIFGLYEPASARISSADREKIIQDNYPNLRLLSQHQSRADLILAGAYWQRGNAAFSITARARIASRIEVGRGWYSQDYIASRVDTTRDFTLNQQKNKLYELSVGYAREFTFFNGMLARLSKLYVGIAPKIVLGGGGFNASYKGQYIEPGNLQNNQYVSEFSMQNNGSYARAVEDHITTQNSEQARAGNFSQGSRFNPTGYGLGFDFGITYLIPLGRELPTVEADLQKSVIDRSIRIAVSINDLGVIRYTEDPLTLSGSRDTVLTEQQSQIETMFLGTDGQFIHYFEEANALPNPFLNAENSHTDSYSELLPTSINTGIMLELSRLKFMADLTLGLNNTAFTTTKLAFHLGLEARPLHQIPVRLGTRLASELPTYFSLGTGIETRYWDLVIGTQLRPRSHSSSVDVVGGAFGGIQFHF